MYKLLEILYRTLVESFTGTTIMGSKLFQPLKVGKVTVNHRIAMAPLTRYRAGTSQPLPKWPFACMF